jgi:hypothetical protein
VSQWLPFAAGSALGRLPTTGDRLSQWAAGVTLAGYVAVAVVAAVAVTKRRDIV